MTDAAPAKGYVFAALVVSIWTGFVLVSRLGGESPLTAWDLVAIRYATSAAILFPLYMVRGRFRVFTLRSWALALTGGITYALLAFSGFKLSPATHAAVLLPGLLPFAVAIVAWFLLGERPAPNRWAGLIIIGAGVACLGAQAFHGAPAVRRGDLLLVGASFSWAIYTVLARRWAVSPWETTVSVVLLTAFAYLPVYIVFLPKNIASVPLASILTQVIYQGILATIVQMLLYVQTVRLIGATRLGTLMALVPALAGFAAVPLLGETLTVWTSAGLLFVTLGAWLCNASGLFSRNKWVVGQVGYSSPQGRRARADRSD